MTSLIVMCVLLFLTPVFKLMPYNTMGAIIIVGERAKCPAGANAASLAALVLLLSR